MATITFGKALKDSAWLEDFYDLDTLKLVEIMIDGGMGTL